MLKGIDVSGYQSISGGTYDSSFVETAYSGSDFVIAKATQGTRPMNSYMTAQLERALADGKLIGVYHYADGGDPAAEADAFLARVGDYIGRALLALDWETADNDAWGSTTWSRRFADRVHERTGIWPVVYTYPAGRSHVASCASDCALWIAGYPDNRFSWELPEMIYNTGAWADWTIWQFSSSGGRCDLNVAQIEPAGWARIAGGTDTAFTPHWVHNDHGWWYALTSTTWYYDCWAFIDGYWYAFDKDGYARKGWYFDGEHWYYLREVEDGYECSMAVGWQDIGKYRYYLKPDAGAPMGAMATRLFKVDGKMYLAGENGNLLDKGVHVLDGHAYAVAEDGSVKTDDTVQVDTDSQGRLTSLR